MLSPRQVQRFCFSCSSDDVVLDNKAGDRICRKCGEVQQGRLINDTDGESGNYPGDEADGNKLKLNRNSGEEDSVMNDRFWFEARGKSVSEDNVQSLHRSSMNTRGRRELDITLVMKYCNDILYNLNLPKQMLVS